MFQWDANTLHCRGIASMILTNSPENKMKWDNNKLKYSDIHYFIVLKSYLVTGTDVTSHSSIPSSHTGVDASYVQRIVRCNSHSVLKRHAVHPTKHLTSPELRRFRQLNRVCSMCSWWHSSYHWHQTELDSEHFAAKWGDSFHKLSSWNISWGDFRYACSGWLVRCWCTDGVKIWAHWKNMWCSATRRNFPANSRPSACIHSGPRSKGYSGFGWVTQWAQMSAFMREVCISHAKLVHIENAFFPHFSVSMFYA